MKYVTNIVFIFAYNGFTKREIVILNAGEGSPHAGEGMFRSAQ
jgi:hypothetical protein